MNYIDLPNLASPTLGSCVVFATDEWFAAADNVIKDEDAVWKQDLYTPFGKWMDGWESRRRRTEGHDWCIIELGIPGLIRAIEVDTAFFTGNFSPKVSIQGVASIPNSWKLKDLRSASIVEPEHGRMGMKASEAEWEMVNQLNSDSWPMLVELTPLGAGYEETRKNLFTIPQGHGAIQYLRLNMGPDGGIARIRIYGEVVVTPERLPFDTDLDLAAIGHGGMAIACSNKHYGHPRNLIAPGRGNCMGDGWETARQPKRPPVYEKGADGLMVLPGYDWAVLQLGLAGIITRLEIDTHYYKGNYPESVMIQGCLMSKDSLSWEVLSDEGRHTTEISNWQMILPRTRLGPDQRHFFDVTTTEKAPISHVKVTIYPDGGIMRIRVLGRKVGDSRL